VMGPLSTCLPPSPVFTILAKSVANLKGGQVERQGNRVNEYVTNG
jgi:hypothetical protein